jgi:hypothetical protein
MANVVREATHRSDHYGELPAGSRRYSRPESPRKSRFAACGTPMRSSRTFAIASPGCSSSMQASSGGPWRGRRAIAT